MGCWTSVVVVGDLKMVLLDKTRRTREIPSESDSDSLCTSKNKPPIWVPTLLDDLSQAVGRLEGQPGSRRDGAGVFTDGHGLRAVKTVKLAGDRVPGHARPRP